MTKRHDSNKHRSRGVVAGAVGALTLLASAQVANAEQVTVKAGDTVWGLAQQHGLSVSALEQANPSIKKLSDSVDLITVGQQLTLSASQTDPSADLNADGTYTVKPGDTLGTIAERYQVTVDQLMIWNGLSASDSLYIGQNLSVTGPAANVVATPVQQSVQQVPAALTPTVQQQAPATTPADSATPAPASDNQSAPTPTAGVSTPTADSSATPVSTSAVAPDSAVTSEQVASASASVQAPISTPAVAASASAASNTTVQSQVTSESAPATSAVVQPTPVASQAVASTAPAATTPAAPTSQANTAVQEQPVTSAQPQQSQTPAVSQPTTQQNASQDLQHGSVVSLATKIANSNSVPYVWGGESLSGMDCSGLVKYVYANAEGKQLPHYTGALENCVDQHPVSEAKPGDLLFWGSHGATYHTAIYTGNNQYVAAAKPGTNVSTYTISPYFNPSFAGTVR